MPQGKVWKYKDNINTDIISPHNTLELSPEEAAKFTMYTIDPDFGRLAQPGDIFVAEHNLGSGSSRENSPLMLKALGIRTVIAMDYARIFYRNCINVGILAIECAETNMISKGDIIDVKPEEGIINNLTTGETYACNKIPPHISAIVEEGGLIPYIQKNRLG